VERGPVEYALRDGAVLRGVELRSPGAAAVALILHDVGADIDALGALPQTLASSEVDVVALDLRGHGVSDGEEPALDRLVGDVGDVVTRLRERAGRVCLVAVGATASAGVALGVADGIDGQVLVLPRLHPDVEVASRRRYCMRMVMHAEGERLVGTPTQAFCAPLLGERLMVSSPRLRDGVSALTGDSALLGHVALFLHRYVVTAARP
jgi:alpha-beta hydrolase superfamily lysophospholipase